MKSRKLIGPARSIRSRISPMSGAHSVIDAKSSAAVAAIGRSVPRRTHTAGKLCDVGRYAKMAAS
jgi:hypothetical protein